MEGGRDPKLTDLIAAWIEKLAKIISFFSMFSFYTIIKINIDCWGSIDCRGRCRWQLHDLHRYLLCTEPLICMRMWFHPPQCFWLFACLIAALPKLKVPVIISKIWNEGLREFIFIIPFVYGVINDPEEWLQHLLLSWTCPVGSSSLCKEWKLCAHTAVCLPPSQEPASYHTAAGWPADPGTQRERMHI